MACGRGRGGGGGGRERERESGGDGEREGRRWRRRPQRALSLFARASGRVARRERVEERAGGGPGVVRCGAFAHEARGIHDPIVDRLAAVDRKLERLLPLCELLRLGLRLRGGKRQRGTACQHLARPRTTGVARRSQPTNGAQAEGRGLTMAADPRRLEVVAIRGRSSLVVAFPSCRQPLDAAGGAAAALSTPCYSQPPRGPARC